MGNLNHPAWRQPGRPPASLRRGDALV